MNRETKINQQLFCQLFIRPNIQFYGKRFNQLFFFVAKQNQNEKKKNEKQESDEEMREKKSNKKQQQQSESKLSRSLS